MKTYKGGKLTIESFDDIYEFSRIIESRPLNKYFECGGGTSHSGDAYNKGTESYEEAEALMKNGYIDGKNRINATVSVFGTTTRAKTYLSPVGFAPHVPNAIIGAPASMINKTVVRRETREINFIYDATASGYEQSENIIKTARMVLDVVNHLQDHNFRINLYVTIASSNSHYSKDSAIGTIIKLKDASQPINTLKVSYPMVHTSFIRRHLFRWMETTPICKYKQYAKNYGYVLSTSSTSIDEIKNLYVDAGVMKRDDIYMNYYTAKGCSTAEDIMTIVNNQLNQLSNK